MQYTKFGANKKTELLMVYMCITNLILAIHTHRASMIPPGYSVGPKYEFVLIDKGIVERVAVTFSGFRQ